MTPRDSLRWIGYLTILEGLALVLGGRQALRFARRISPPWYRLWLRPLIQLPPFAVRVLGGLEVVLGLRIVAFVPPVQGFLGEIADSVLNPVLAGWNLAVAKSAEERYVELLRQYVPPGARVLDLGCGQGDNLARMLRFNLPFGSYVGLDMSETTIARARARFDGVEKVEFLQNDLLNEQIPTGEFDLILSIWALDRVPDPFGLIVRAVRQLRHGGHALLLFASPPRDRWVELACSVAKMLGRELHPASLYNGLPSFTASEEFAGGLVSLVLLENEALAVPPISASPPEDAWLARGTPSDVPRHHS